MSRTPGALDLNTYRIVDGRVVRVKPRFATAPPAATYVGPLPICDDAELRRRNAIANARREATGEEAARCAD